MKGSDFMSAVRSKKPLVQHITNYVTVNDCANITLCAGGAPVMSHESKDVVDLVRVSNAVVLNIGTADEKTVKSMLVAGMVANDHSIPVVLDPVGVGATEFRNRTVDLILKKIKVSVIKGNGGEIGFMSGVGGEVRGVDSVSTANGKEAVKVLAEKYGCIVAMTGEFDYVSDGKQVVTLMNGDPIMDCVSGTGCMVSSVIGCYVGASGASIDSVVAAISAFSIAGEIAAADSEGPGTFKPRLMDALYNLVPEEFDSIIKRE